MKEISQNFLNNSKLGMINFGTKRKKTRAKSSYGTCDEARRAKIQEIIWYEL